MCFTTYFVHIFQFQWNQDFLSTYKHETESMKEQANLHAHVCHQNENSVYIPYLEINYQLVVFSRCIDLSLYSHTQIFCVTGKGPFCCTLSNIWVCSTTWHNQFFCSDFGSWVMHEDQQTWKYKNMSIKNSAHTQTANRVTHI